MTREEAKEIFLNRGFVNEFYDGDKWRQSIIVISEWLEQESKVGHWIDTGSGQECSVCHEIQYGYDSHRFYCSNCRAKMEGTVENDGG